MSIRQGYYLIGNTVEIVSSFKDETGATMEASGVTIFIKKPDKTVQEFPVSAINGTVTMDYIPNQIGLHIVRIECDEPTPTAKESSFEVVASRVITV